MYVCLHRMSNFEKHFAIIITIQVGLSVTSSALFPPTPLVYNKQGRIERERGKWLTGKTTFILESYMMELIPNGVTEPAQLTATYMYKLIQRRQRIPTRLAGEVNSCVSCVCADLRWKSSGVLGVPAGLVSNLSLQLTHLISQLPSYVLISHLTWSLTELQS